MTMWWANTISCGHTKPVDVHAKRRRHPRDRSLVGDQHVRPPIVTAVLPVAMVIHNRLSTSGGTAA
jgi:hypothetical protein